MSDKKPNISKTVQFSSTVLIFEVDACGSDFRLNPNYKSDYAKNNFADTDGQLGKKSYDALRAQKRTESHNNKIYKLQGEIWDLRSELVEKIKTGGLSSKKKIELQKEVDKLYIMYSEMSGKILAERHHKVLD
jgi:hypothetical protein